MVYSRVVTFTQTQLQIRTLQMSERRRRIFRSKQLSRADVGSNYMKKEIQISVQQCALLFMLLLLLILLSLFNCISYCSIVLFWFVVSILVS